MAPIQFPEHSQQGTAEELLGVFMLKMRVCRSITAESTGAAKGSLPPSELVLEGPACYAVH